MIELPPPDTKSWTARRKAVVQAVRLGLISLEEAWLRYDLSIEELFGWERVLDQRGHPGLRATRLQITAIPKGPSSAKGSN